MTGSEYMVHLEKHGALFQHQLSRFLQSIPEEEVAGYINRYVHFNRVFAGAATRLAGTVHLSGALFGETLAARVAARVVGAIVDEYVDRRNGAPYTHCEMSEEFLSGCVAYFADKPKSSALNLSGECHLTLRESVLDGYGCNVEQNSPELIRAIGYHLATEFNGAIEFNCVDQWLSAKQPELVSFLKGRTTETGHNQYSWVKVHTYVEEEHFAVSNGAVTMLLEWAERTGTKDVSAQICEGISSFYTDVFKYVLMSDLATAMPESTADDLVPA